MQPQEQPTYYPQPPERPSARWAEDLEKRSIGHTFALVLVIVLLLANLGLTFYVFSVVHGIVG